MSTAQLRDAPWDVIGAVAAGGMAGGAARYGIGLAFPAAPGGFPWATFAINASGCALIGGLMVLITDLVLAHPLARPFLGTGVLGGYTTFSAYAVEVQRLIGTGAAGVALAYLVVTPVAALVAVWLGNAATRAGLRLWRSRLWR